MQLERHFEYTYHADLQLLLRHLFVPRSNEGVEVGLYINFFLPVGRYVNRRWVNRKLCKVLDTDALKELIALGRANGIVPRNLHDRATTMWFRHYSHLSIHLDYIPRGYFSVTPSEEPIDLQRIQLPVFGRGGMVISDLIRKLPDDLQRELSEYLVKPDTHKKSFSKNMQNILEKMLQSRITITAWNMMNMAIARTGHRNYCIRPSEYIQHVNKRDILCESCRCCGNIFRLSKPRANPFQLPHRTKFIARMAYLQRHTFSTGMPTVAFGPTLEEHKCRFYPFMKRTVAVAPDGKAVLVAVRGAPRYQVLETVCIKDGIFSYRLTQVRGLQNWAFESIWSNPVLQGRSIYEEISREFDIVLRGYAIQSGKASYSQDNALKFAYTTSIDRKNNSKTRKFEEL